MRFLTPQEELVIDTKKGTFTLKTTQYFIIEDEKRNTSALMINKEGIQCIEDFFDVKVEMPSISQVWNANNNFNIIASIKMQSGDIESFGIASGNVLNLTNYISQSYAAEMAVKRARATASLEILRKYYIGKDRLPLLYSSFDEFKSEEGINNNFKDNNVQTKPENQSFNNMKNEESRDINSTQDSQDVGTYIIVSNKFKGGISIKDLANKDMNYFLWIAKSTNPNGKFVEYQQKVLQYAKENNIKIA